MKKLILSLFEPHPALNNLAKNLDAEIITIEYHQFPDKESYIRFDNNNFDLKLLNNAHLYILNSLDRPDNKITALIFAIKTARELGVQKVTLIAPYLSYMRQDKVFKPGEGVTSRYFAELLSLYIDELITIDPHLHRYNNLNQIYNCNTTVLSSYNLIAEYIKTNISKPMLIGPDSESEQWVKNTAESIDAPYLILEKIRHGDYNVEVSLPEAKQYSEYTPVLVDDIISSAATMIKTLENIKQLKLKPAVCIGIHAVFADDSYYKLSQSYIADIVTTNSIEHPTNKIDVSVLIC